MSQAGKFERRIFMNFEEVKKYIDENKGDKELAAYLQGLIGVEGVQV